MEISQQEQTQKFEAWQNLQANILNSCCKYAQVIKETHENNENRNSLEKEPNGSSRAEQYTIGIKNSLDEKSDALNTEEKRLFKTQIETIQIELQ